PLAGILNLENCHASEGNPYRLHEVYSDYKIAPMAGNVQIVFFRPKKNAAADGSDVLVKFMLNEREIAVDGLEAVSFPFYRWGDVSAFWQKILAD
ncbi:MAG: histidine-type phosphatase, partial [Muribaculaceae bacterium]|nr:histidine-type phosphatase [Muribaculaceae bacterium]